MTFGPLSRIKSSTFITSPVFALSCLFLSIPIAHANPEDGVVAAGTAAITSAGNTLTVNQGTDRVIIDWRAFNIGNGELTQFIQPNSGSVAINRVNASGGASQILGNITANGQIVILNQSGVYFGKDAKVDVAGLVASTLDVDAAGFMAGGHLVLTGNPANQSMIINDGLISARQAGLVGLVAPHVENNGVIQAELGHVVLASGTRATLDFYGDGLLSIATDEGATSQSVKNTGHITNNGGTVTMTAAAARSVVDNLVENSGVITAHSIGMRNGKIVLMASGKITKNHSKVVNSGTLDASGKASGETGGTVELLADEVYSKAGSVIDVSGDAGGGTIRIGGDYQGGGDIPTSVINVVESGATLNANAITNGDGGHIYVWSDGGTWYNGSLTAKGGAQSGNGGDAEVSGKQYLDFRGEALLLAANGRRGRLLLDPTNITVTSALPDSNVNSSISSGNYTYQPSGADVMSYISEATIQSVLGNGDVTIQTISSGTQSGDIIIETLNPNDGGNGSRLSFIADHDILVNGALTSLSSIYLIFQAGHDIVANASITSPGSMQLKAGHDVVVNAPISVNGISIDFGHNFTANYDITSLSSYIYFSTSATNQDLGVNGGAGTLQISAADFAHLHTNGFNFQNYRDMQFGAGSYGDLDILTQAGGSVSTLGDISVTYFGAEADHYNLGGRITGTGSSVFSLAAATIGTSLGWGDGQAGSVQLTDSQISNLSGFTRYYLYRWDSALGARNWGNFQLTVNGRNTSINGNQAFSNSAVALTQSGFLNIQGNLTGVDSLDITAATLTTNGSITGNGSASGYFSLWSSNDIGLATSSTGIVLDNTALANIGNFSKYTYRSTGAAGNIYVGAHAWNTPIEIEAKSIYFNGDVTVNGDMKLITNNVSFPYRVNGNGTGALTIQEESYASSLGLGDGTAASNINLSNASLANLETGWNSINFVMSGDVSMASHTWNENVAVQGNNVTTLGAQNVGAHNLTLMSGEGAAGELSIGGNLSGTGILTLGSTYSGTGFDIAANTTNSLSTTELNYIQNGWNQLIIDNHNSGSAIILSAYDWSSRSFAGGIKLWNSASVFTVNGAQNFGTNNVEISTQGVVDLNANIAGTGKLKLSTTGSMKLQNITLSGFRISTADVNSFMIGKGWSSYDLVTTSGGATLGGAFTWDKDLTIDAGGVVAITIAQNFGSNNLTIKTDGNPNITQTLTGIGTLTIQQRTASKQIELASSNALSSGVIGLTATELSKISNGWSKLVFGQSTATGGVTIGTMTWNDPAYFLSAGTIKLEGSQTSADASAPTNKLVFAGSAFDNTAAATINPGSGRYLVYSATPSSDIYGGLTRPTKRYNKTYATYDPSAVAESGNVFLYSVAPVLNITIDNITREYGLANPSLTYTINSGLIDGDTSGTAISSASLSSVAALSSNVGTYGITGSFTPSALGYTLNVTNGNLAVTKATLTATADSNTREYGLSNPALGVTYTGFRNGETSAVIDTLASVSTPAVLWSDVGNYATTASGGIDNNYAFSYVAGNLSVTKATLTATANNQTRQYGLANPALTVTYGGFRNGDSASVLDTAPTVTTAATATSLPNSYNIHIAGASDNNYTLVYTDGTLVVTKKDLNVSVSPVTIVLGATPPPYTINYSGFVLGQDVSALTTPATASDNAAIGYNVAGVYTITPSGVVSSRYNPIYTTAALRVEAPIVIPDAVIKASTNLVETTVPVYSYSASPQEAAPYNNGFIYILPSGNVDMHAMQSSGLLLITPEFNHIYNITDIIDPKVINEIPPTKM